MGSAQRATSLARSAALLHALVLQLCTDIV